MSFCLVLVLGLVQTSPLETYKRGKELFDASYFEQAAPLLSMFIEDPGAASAVKVTGARWMLAQALFFTNDAKGAGKHVRLLLQKGAAIPDDLPPRFLTFVEEQKKAVPAPHVASKPPPKPPTPKERPPEPEKTPDSSPERRTQPEPARPVVPPATPAQPAPIVEPPPEPRSPDAPTSLQLAPEQAAVRELPPMPGWYLRGLPGGVGHFIAKDYVGGGVFMALTLASAAANIALLVLNARALGPDGAFAKGPQYPALYIAQHVTAGVFYGVLLSSLIDGIAGVPRRVAGKWAP